MTRNLKAIGMALAAVLALGAFAASTALAEGTPEYFHAEKQNVVVTGAEENTQVLSIPTGSGPLTVECEHISVEGTQSGKEHAAGNFESEFSTVRPTYYNGTLAQHKEGATAAKCNSFLGKNTVRVDTEACHYKLYSTTDANGHAKSDVICAEGQSIKITGPAGCTITIKPQTGLTGVHYTNKEAGSSRDITVESTVKNIHYAASFACLFAGIPSTGTDASYTGNVTAKGFTDEDPTKATGEYVDGAQVGIWKGPTT
ncbi:MAG TPA: hypothetical protein VMS60_06920 [Solirubrobacterales bacterium]|nr:hypothetical protein [Solirubrobacterales bacterium]